MQAFEATNVDFDRAAAPLDVTDDTGTPAITPDRELWVEVTIEMDSGEIGNCIGYRVQHDGAPGPSQGGLRSHPHVEGMPPPTSVASDRPATRPPPP